MPTLHVAGPDDLDIATLYAILRLRSEVFVVEQACAYQDIDGRDLESGTRHLWLTGADPAPLAYLRILDDIQQGDSHLGDSDDNSPARSTHEGNTHGGGAAGGDAVRIGRVCVSPSARRQGHAGTLLTAAVDLIGDRESVLDAQAYAVALYAAAGFVEDGPEFVEDGIPHVPMRRMPPR
jgi:ElaA protein